MPQCILCSIWHCKLRHYKFTIYHSWFFPINFTNICLPVDLVLYTNMPPKNFFKTDNWFKNIGFHSKFIIFSTFIAFVLEYLMHLGLYRPPSDQSMLIFKHLPTDYDYIGKSIEVLEIFKSVGIAYILKTSLHLFAYFSLIFISIKSLIFISRCVNRLRNNNHVNSEDLKDIQKAETSKNEIQKSVENPKQNWYVSNLLLFLNLLIFCFYIALAIYCYLKLKVEVFDFRSFKEFKPVTDGLILAWLLSSIGMIYLFLVNMGFPHEQFNLKFATSFFSKYWTDPWTVPWTFQQFIIPVLASLFIFGATIFPRIPYATGGGEPRYINLVMIDSDHPIQDERLFLIGESNQFLFVIATNKEGDEGRALQINKSTVAYIETRKLENGSNE